MAIRPDVLNVDCFKTVQGPLYFRKITLSWSIVFLYLSLKLDAQAVWRFVIDILNLRPFIIAGR